MRARRRITFASIWVLLSLAAGLGLGEMAARLLAERRPVFELRGLHVFRPDRPWLYGLRPGAEGRISETGAALYRINADGLRGPRVARPKPAGVTRVVVVGDSIAFGYGVQEPETFPRVLETLLAGRVPQARVEVVNLGVGGYNAWNEAELLTDIGLGYEPDLVLVQFCINDLNDPTVHFDAQTRVALEAIPDQAFPDPSVRRGSRHSPSALLGWCARSRLCGLARDAWLSWRGHEFDDATRRAAVRPMEDTRQDRAEWRWLEARYQEMAAAAEAAGARFALLAFPYPQQLTASGRHAVQQRMLALGRQHGWTVIDPLPAFQQAQARGARLFLDWWHPTPAGHRVAAEEALRVLACGGELGDEARAACPGAHAGSGGE